MFAGLQQPFRVQITFHRCIFMTQISIFIFIKKTMTKNDANHNRCWATQINKCNWQHSPCSWRCVCVFMRNRNESTKDMIWPTAYMSLIDIRHTCLRERNVEFIGAQDVDRKLPRFQYREKNISARKKHIKFTKNAKAVDGKFFFLAAACIVAKLMCWFFWNNYMSLIFACRQLTDNEIHTIEKDAFQDLISLERL